ncbi:hypothetical protein MSG28_006305 [Choristoneura fumiferana]|uniref:Uncharacterized protein n=1 Tax=Choristoneura fumiferana TaxID=7141 RepID=A0ACC0JEE7_CHOFU|nr:hypothetical protein MSG28_006305 [Choristoneura fumiferana]
MYGRLLTLLAIAVIVSGELNLCRRKTYIGRAEQADDNGKKCWDKVKVPFCSGRCDSREVSDWRFPFKKSHHPVCMHSTRRTLHVKLRHCDEGVAEGTEQFQFIGAEDCRCMTCSSQHTSCEWLPPHSSIVEGILDEKYEDNKIDD